MSTLKKYLVNPVSRLIRFLVGKTPLLRAFVYAKKDAHKASFREFSLIWGISILPILGAIAVDVVTGYSVFIGHVGNDTSWLGGFGVRLYDNVKAGEVFIYVSSVMGPVILVMDNYNEGGVRFPEYLTFQITLGLLLLCSVGTFALYRAHVIHDQHFVDCSAVILYALSLLLWYCALLYEQVRPDRELSEGMQSEANGIRQAIENGGTS
jgi:hypothetical protein